MIIIVNPKMKKRMKKINPPMINSNFLRNFLFLQPISPLILINNLLFYPNFHHNIMNKVNQK